VNWSELELAGAFVIGASLGAVVTIRVAKVVAGFLAGLQHRPRRPDDDNPDTPGS
jgi:hypothetical protein